MFSFIQVSFFFFFFGLALHLICFFYSSHRENRFSFFFRIWYVFDQFFFHHFINLTYGLLAGIVSVLCCFLSVLPSLRSCNIYLFSLRKTFFMLIFCEFFHFSDRFCFVFLKVFVFFLKAVFPTLFSCFLSLF